MDRINEGRAEEIPQPIPPTFDQDSETHNKVKYVTRFASCRILLTQVTPQEHVFLIS